MSEPHAAIVLSQLRRLDEFIAARQSLAKRYDAAVEQIGLRPLDVPPNAHCNYYKYVAFLPDGVDRVGAEADACASSSTSACRARSTTLPCISNRCSNRSPIARLPGAEWLCARHICLPLYPSLDERDADYVIESLASELQ